MWRITTFAFFFAVVLEVSGCGGSSSALQSPPLSTIPFISSISPTSAITGSPDLALTITGSNFAGTTHNIRSAVWSVNGINTNLATTFGSSTQLTAIIPAAQLSSAVTAQIIIEYGDPMGDVPLSKSNPVSFSVAAPPPGTPSISSISPTSATAGSPDATLTVTGSNFATGNNSYNSVGVWSVNGMDTFLRTTSITSAALTAVIPATLLTTPVTAKVSVWTFHKADDGPSSVSNSVNFSVTSAAPAIAISPTADTLGFNAVRQFVATLSGADSAVAWSVEEGAAGGSISPGGLYTAATTTGTFHVVANSLANPSATATATVSVVNSGFSPTGDMHTARSGHMATLLSDGRVLVVGGADATTEVYDPSTATFSPTGDMTTPRYGATATLLTNGKVLITGGFGPGTSILPRLNTAELYDPLTGTFSATGSMTDARILHTATLLNDGRVLITGGTRAGGGGGAAIASAELYDPTSGTFSPTSSMNSDRAQHTATLLTNGEVLVAGGWNGHAADAADDPPWDPLFVELYDPSSGTFKYAGSMSTTRIGHSATRLADGKVLLIGGIFSVQNIHTQLPDLRYAEIFDPATGNFSGLDDLTIARHGYTVTLLRSGEVLLIGGKVLDLVVTTTELLNPTTGALSATGGLGTERVGHTATLLNDGRVLVTGGTNSKGNALASAELYH